MTWDWSRDTPWHVFNVVSNLMVMMTMMTSMMVMLLKVMWSLGNDMRARAVDFHDFTLTIDCVRVFFCFLLLQ